MKNIFISGSDIEEISFINGVALVGAIVRRPSDKISIFWQVDNASGTTNCEAWQGQHEIDCLVKAGYEIIKIGLNN